MQKPIRVNSRRFSLAGPPPLAQRIALVRSRVVVDGPEMLGEEPDGMGLAWLPSWLVCERVQAGALVELLPDDPGFLYVAHALWLRTPHLPLKVRLAVDA